jgi:hypothetical protein
MNEDDWAPFRISRLFEIERMTMVESIHISLVLRMKVIPGHAYRSETWRCSLANGSTGPNRLLVVMMMSVVLLLEFSFFSLRVRLG